MTKFDSRCIKQTWICMTFMIHKNPIRNPKLYLGDDQGLQIKHGGRFIIVTMPEPLYLFLN